MTIMNMTGEQKPVDRKDKHISWFINSTEPLGNDDWTEILMISTN